MKYKFTDFKKMPLNEVRLRIMMCKRSNKRMQKLKMQNLWNNLNKSYSPNIYF